MVLYLHKDPPTIQGQVPLPASKSLSNRVLLIRALAPESFPIHHLAEAEDTQRMLQLLNSSDSDEEVFDAGPAGTTFRFLTAWLAFRPGQQILTGSPRMKQRPIGALVDALRQLGAQIEYLEREGYPPLRIGEAHYSGQYRIPVRADVSSQFISALLLIAPTLPQGLEITLEGSLVSRSYLRMTLALMHHFGVPHQWKGTTIAVPHATYVPKPYTVEGDWSAASYYFAMAALSETTEMELLHLQPYSFQGDAIVAQLAQQFGVRHEFDTHVLKVYKDTRASLAPFFEHDFIDCPDIAQTLAVMCAATGLQGMCTGLQTLQIKETDRIAALQKELAKIGVTFAQLPPRFSKKTGKIWHMIDGKAQLPASPIFDTYEDHRMAMAFAPLALLGRIGIRQPEVVGKSYPSFWAHLQDLGFEIEEVP